MPTTDEDLVKAAEMDSDGPEQEEKSTSEQEEPKPIEKPDEKPESPKEEEPKEEGENLDEKPPKVEASAEQAEEPKKPTRKERREARKQSLIEASRRDNTRPTDLPEPRPHEPLDYNKSEQFNVEDLEADRKAVADNAYLEAARLEREVSEQEKFWTGMEYEARILTSNPDYAWLDDKNPDFDPDRAETVNELYLDMIGYKEEPLFDAKTRQPIMDPQTGRQAMRGKVARTDISYEKFVKNFVDTVKSWADDEVETSQQNLAEQRANAGIRPGGGSRKTIGELKPGDISKMSDEDLEKYGDEIDRQIMSMLE